MAKYVWKVSYSVMGDASYVSTYVTESAANRKVQQLKDLPEEFGIYDIKKEKIALG